MNHLTLILLVSITFSTLAACTTSDPRGYHPVDIGNTPNEKQMVREGRDTQTYLNTTMPMPDASSSNYSGEMPESKIQNNQNDIQVDDKIDFSKI